MAKQKKSAKPKDLQITRSDGKFTCKWKTGEKYEKQTFKYKIKGSKEWGKWHSIKVKAKATSATFECPLKSYAPNGSVITAVKFKVRGEAKNKSVSDWKECVYGLKKPNVPALTMAVLSQESASFTFSVADDKTKPEVFTRTEYMTAFSSGTASPSWGSAVQDDAGSTLTYREDSTTVSSGSHTRWVRVKARGLAGDTDWVTAKRVYAKPKASQIIGTKYTQDGSGVHGWFQWTSSYDSAYPIDSTAAEYIEVVPDANVSLPAGELQWKSAGGLSGAQATDSTSFDIDHAIDDDKVVFVRINTTHENWTTHSEPTILLKGVLSAPDAPALSEQDPTQYTVTVTADNNSVVVDSFLVVSYKSDTQPQIDIGIIPHGQSSVNVRCPAWGSEDKSLGVRAVVGSYTQTVRADNVRIYDVSESMSSKGIRWTDGNLPVAPGNVTVTATDVVGSVRVGWQWLWAKADSAEITWSDHEDAWESTDEPDSYIVSNLHASQWNIAGLELGKTWYVRVRLIDGSGEDDVKGPWSPIESIDLASAPAIPTLTLSSEKEVNGQKMSVITMDDILTAYWSYITTDGSGQAYAEICEAEIVNGTIVYGRVIARTESAQHIDIDPKDPLIGWSAGDTKLLCVRVASGSGKSSQGWSAPVSVSVADPIEARIAETSLVDEEITENPQTYTGDIVSFESENVAPEAKSLKVALEPIQEGSGTPSPDNVRPISGHTECVTERTGKNLLPKYAEGTTVTQNGITGTANADGSITYSGTSTGTFWGLGNSDTVLIKAGTYTLSARNNDNVGLGLVNANTGQYFNGLSGSTSKTVIFENDTEIYFYTSIGSGKTVNTTATYQLELGTTATSYEPYDSTTYTTTLGRTVYGGTLDVVSGVLTVDRAYVDLGTLTWSKVSGNIYANFYSRSLETQLKFDASVPTVMSSAYAPASYNSASSTGDGYVWVNSQKTVRIKDTTKSEMTASEFATAMSGVQLVYELATPQTYQLTPQQVQLLLGNNNVWSDGGITLTTADAMVQAKALKKLPLTVTVTGAGNGGTTTVAIERFGARSTDNRPDERTYDGFDGETVALIDQTGEAQISIDRNSDGLFGALDDGAWYRIVATAEDALGQTSTATQEFIVDWTHQAVVPDADIEVLEQNVVKIKPKLPAELPDGWTFDEGDTCDIYRLTADLPELIVEGAQFGTDYIDPYPAIGEFGGHRLVYRTAEGDYTTPDNSIAWYDTDEEEGDIIESDAVLIDFNGTQIALRYNLDLSNSWEKDFRETRYLGGSIQGDWNEGVSRSASVSAITVSFTDQETIRLMRRLADYAGVCHIRTLDGSSFPCDIQVSETREQGGYNKLVQFSLSITRVDTEEYEGMTYADWRQENGLE